MGTLYHKSCKKISIHALREEGDSSRGVPKKFSIAFLSTPSARRATSLWRSGFSWPWYFYPRPPRGGRRFATQICWMQQNISIHALREEGDCRHHQGRAATVHFYPRPPRGGRRINSAIDGILILFLSTPSARRATFAPMSALQVMEPFLSTPSARRATAKTEKNISAFVSL